MALTAWQQGCLKALKGHPPACGRLKPHRSSRSLRTSSRRRAPAAVASEAAAHAADEAAGGAAAWGDRASMKSPSSPEWLSNLPEDVQYDFIICQIGLLKRRLTYLRDAPSGTNYLPRDAEKRFNDELDQEHQKLWRQVKPWRALDDRLRDQAFDDLICAMELVCLRGATVAKQLTAIPDKLSELRAQLDGLPERNIWNGTVLSVRRRLSGAQHHLNTPRLMQVPRELNYPTVWELLGRTRTVLISLVVLAVLVYSVDEVLRWAQFQVIKLSFEAKLLATCITGKAWALAANMPMHAKNLFMQALNKSVAA